MSVNRAGKVKEEFSLICGDPEEPTAPLVVGCCFPWQWLVLATHHLHAQYLPLAPSLQSTYYMEIQLMHIYPPLLLQGIHSKLPSRCLKR